VHDAADREEIMLLGLDPLLSPDLLYALASAGHGDRIAIVDANFPAASTARRLISLHGADATAALVAVLSVLPVDNFEPNPVVVMEVVGDPEQTPAAVAEFTRVLASAGVAPPARLPRHDFYHAARGAYAVVLTGERRLYGNIMLTKGVVP
jgi:L-fucose mutarotase